MTVLTAASPRLTVSYGSFPIDETKGCILCSEYDSQDSSTQGSLYIEFRVRLLSPTGVVATDDATFAALIADVESNLRIPRQTLLVKIGASTVRNWNFSGTQTAILIQPELKLIEENCRDYRYGLRVTCQFQGNVPDNVYRRESVTQIGTSLRERRTCTITATWTSSNGVTAYQRYLNSGDDFYEAYLPENVVDQYDSTGAWVRADENPSFNDENSIIQATRVYWEIFDGRRESTVQTVSHIEGRRVCTVPSVWVASGVNTALQNYTDNGGAFFDAALPDNVASGTWVLVDEEPGYNDQNGVLTVVRVYHEVVSGLREVSVQVTTDASGIRKAVVSGVYYTTSQSAKLNYLAGINGLVTGVLAGEGITHYESHAIPKVTGYDTTGLRYFFSWTVTELAYPQGSDWDDPNVTFETLDIQVTSPVDAQAFTDGLSVTRLKTVTASFVAMIDKGESDNPVGLWESGLRAHVISAVTSKLGSYVETVQVVAEDVGAGLHINQLVGVLKLVVTGGSLLWLKLSQTVMQRPGRSFVARGDGTAFSAYPYRATPEKRLIREGSCEYVVGGTPPVLFDSGDATASGFGMIDTGVTAQESIDAQNDPGELGLGSGWFIDREAAHPYVYKDTPTTRGDDFQTVVHQVIETWLYLAALEPGTSL